MKNKNSLDVRFRYGTSDDCPYFNNLFLKDVEARKALCITGFDENIFKNDTWRASFVAETMVRFGDSFEDMVVGYVTVAGGNPDGFNTIMHLYVEDSFRRQGFGSEMISFASKFAFSNWNAAGLQMYTIDNKPMEKMLEKLGFNVDGIDMRAVCSNGAYRGQKRWVRVYK